MSLFTPLLNYLSDGEVERTEKEKDKEMNKRRKRNTRGRRGVVLPDRDPIRTYRTPAIGFPQMDAATLALQAVKAPTTKRAAAAAASLTIANIVTSENRDDNAPFLHTPHRRRCYNNTNRRRRKERDFSRPLPSLPPCFVPGHMWLPLPHQLRRIPRFFLLV